MAKIMDPIIAAANAIESVLEAKTGESLLIIADDERKEVAQAFATGALSIGLWTRILVLDTEEKQYRKEVPKQLVEILNSKNSPDIYINILRGIAEETPFRIKIIHLETRKHRARLGHCPGITMDMLTEGALSLSLDEHTTMQDSARALLAVLQDVSTVHVTSPSGSDFTLSVKGRTWFSDTFINWKDMKWMNLPTGEVLAGPVENSMEGTLICDLAVGGVGPITKPVRIDTKNGAVVKVDCEDGHALRIIKETQAIDKMAKHVGEFAFGLNPKARLVQEFLESEKVSNAIHVAFGNNMDYPGIVANNSATHQDFLVDKPTVVITYTDGRTLKVMEDGKIIV